MHSTRPALGIRGFQAWAARTAGPGLYRPFDARKTLSDNLMIDVNALLHPLCRSSTDAEHLGRKLVSQVRRILRSARGRNTAFMIDGPAPYAKLALQAGRRRARPGSTRTGALDTLWLTPGTAVLDTVTEHLVEAFPWATVSGPRDAGEGELKMVQWLRETGKASRRRQGQGRGAAAAAPQSLTVVGNDSDIVLIMSAMSPALRHFDLVLSSGGGSLNSMKSLQVHEFWKAFNVPRRDITAVCLLAGNDYIPKLRYADIDKLWVARNACVPQGRSMVTPRGDLRVPEWIDFMRRIEAVTGRGACNEGGTEGDVCVGCLRCVCVR